MVQGTTDITLLQYIIHNMSIVTHYKPTSPIYLVIIYMCDPPNDVCNLKSTGDRRMYYTQYKYLYFL